MNGAGNTAVPANAASAGNGITDGMEPVQRDCWLVYNHPDAQARESGIGTEEVRCTIVCYQFATGSTCVPGHRQ